MIISIPMRGGDYAMDTSKPPKNRFEEMVLAQFGGTPQENLLTMEEKLPPLKGRRGNGT
jgi:hypothetical protein